MTLPELHERTAKFRVLPKKKLREIGSGSPRSISPTLSEAQSHLKAQRKNLLTRLLSRGPFKRESRILTRPIDTLSNNYHFTEPQDASHPQRNSLRTTTEPFRSAANQHTGNQPSATRESSSYVSFDGANSTVRQSVRESWTKKIWDKFSYLLVSSSRAYSLKNGTKKQAEPQTPTYAPILRDREIRIFPPSAVRVIDSYPKPTITSGTVELDGVRALRKTLTPGDALNDEPRRFNRQQAQLRVNPTRPTSLPTPESAILETSATRTASWAASMSSELHQRKSVKPQGMEWIPSSDDEEEVSTEIPPTPLRANTGEATGFNQALSQGPSGTNSPSDLSHSREGAWRQNKGNGEAESVSTGSEPLTRTRSQQQYLANREAERQAYRDRNILRAKAKAKIMKEKADEQTTRFKKLKVLHSKKTCPFGKWSKKDQLELELLRMQLGIRVAKNSWKMSDLRRLGLADLEELRQSLLPTAKVANRQPKRYSLPDGSNRP